MRRLIWADQHFYHERIIELCNRPFTTVAEMNTAMCDHYNDVVKPDDVVFFVGDVAIDSKWKEGLELVSKLPGKKILIPGNHDRVSAHHRDFHNYMRAYMEVYDAVSQFARMGINAQRVMVSHYPYPTDEDAPLSGDHTKKDRYSQYRLRDEGVRLFCGHVHDLWKTNGHQVNVGVDVNDFRPILVEEAYKGFPA